MQHTRFHYATLDDVRGEIARVDTPLPLSDDLSGLKSPIRVAQHTLPSRLAVQPMEGSDGMEDGSPGELTRRRYLRFVRGGAALIWFEAVAIAPEVRASAHQLYLHRENVGAFAALIDELREEGLRANGFAPLIVMQVAHSGRYSKPTGTPDPLIAYNNPVLEDAPIDGARILTDDQLKRYEPMYGETARLARQAGFDGVDIKACHRYLINELFSAYTRPGLYGGSFENRTRFFLNAFRAARAAVPGDFLLTTRMNVYDGFPHPWGFGVAQDAGLQPELSEAIRLIGLLVDEFDLPLINITAGNPYKNPHVNRPYDQGNYVPDEHPFEGLYRMMRCFGAVQQAYPRLPVMASGLSYLRQFSPQWAAGMLKDNLLSLAGFGRMAFANPSFANQILSSDAIDEKSVCVTCGRCAQLLRAGRPSGCVVRDREVYSL